MQNRSPIAVFFISLFTFGIYSLVWLVKTKTEINELTDAEIPTAWIWLIPFASIYWLWKYSQGVEQVTEGATSAGVAFLMLMLLGPIGQAVLQTSYNNVTAELDGPMRITIEGAGA